MNNALCSSYTLLCKKLSSTSFLHECCFSVWPSFTTTHFRIWSACLLILQHAFLKVEFGLQKFQLDYVPYKTAFKNGKADHFAHQLMCFSQNIHYCLNSCHLHLFHMNAVYFVQPTFKTTYFRIWSACLWILQHAFLKVDIGLLIFQLDYVNGASILNQSLIDLESMT